ncbi:MAG: tannase/feruloyl esterase family alpha/beta hydrolase [Candidatus Rokuibacteriota bacterium]|nr:MAG: tannase/feruloyl esterase family alpha/beta hydrolase [Candidatus Rokubacteria bacterium]
MGRRTTLFIAPVMLFLSIVLTSAPAVAATPCESLAAALPPGTTGITTQSVPAGSFTPPGSMTPLTNLPAFCRVAATLTPTSTSLIGVEVWMPTTTWNGNFRGEGSGGSAGSFSFGPMATALRLGYATMSTDNGHKGSLWTFAAQPEKVNDFGYRAFHVSTLAAKSLIKAFYGNAQTYSYYVGCSQGGHHGLMEAQRYPEDFDGIIAGDPGHDWTHLMIAELWTGAVSHLKSAETDLPQKKLDLLTQNVLNTCGDPVNGPLGFLVEPRRCTFDPSQLQCHAGDADTCLTPAQVQAVKLIYQGPVNPRTGAQIYPGFVRGSENAWRQVLVGPRSGGVPIPGGSSFQFFINGIFNDPNYKFLSFNYDDDALHTDTKPAGSGLNYSQVLNAMDPDLEVFKKRGGKLIMYHGYADPFVTPMSSIAYYNRVTGEMHPGLHKGNDGTNAAGLNRTVDFARLFMVPGMWHCGGGPGPSNFDVFTPLTQWVEHGVAPDRIIGTHAANATGQGGFTRPLCPFPQESVYNGDGNTTDAANFACKVVK